MNYLHEELEKYIETDAYPFHMPGAKRRMPGCECDITEIDGFDDLRDAEGLLMELERGWAGLYGASHAFLSVNGSTAGNLASVFALTEAGDEIIIIEDCHWSVRNAARLRHLVVHTIGPDRSREGFCLDTTKDIVENALKTYKKTKLVVLTSPTYEGMVSDAEGIAEAVHRAGAYLLVDCAHGAHLGVRTFCGEHGLYYPANPITQGADAVVLSLHKTLPVMGQVSLVLTEEYADKIKEYLNIFQTSSPSYVLMASASRGLKLIIDEGSRLFMRYVKNLSDFHTGTSELKNLRIFDHDKMELSKIVISTVDTDISGERLMSILREDHHLELERAAAEHCIAMTSVMDEKAGFDRLLEALICIDRQLG